MARSVGSERGLPPGAVVLGTALIGVAILLVFGLAVEIAVPWTPEFQILPLAIGIAGTLIALIALTRTREARAGQEKAADDVAALAGRLATLESRIATLGSEQAAEPPQMSDVAHDVHGLTQLVRSLAEALAGHEREIGRLRIAEEEYRNAPAPVAPSSAASLPPAHPAPAAYRPETGAPTVPSFFSGGHLEQIATAAAAPRRAPAPSETSPLVAALDPAAVDLHVQPIVSLPQRHTKLYEVYAVLRLSETDILVPDEFVPTLERLGHVARLDAIVIAKAATFSRRLAAAGRNLAIACNVAGPSLTDRPFLDDLDAQLAADPMLAGRLVLEVSERTWREIGPVADSISRLSARGLAFSVDGIRSADLDPDEFAARGARFVKIDASRLVGAGGASRLAARLSRSPVRLVASQVESDGIVPDLIESGVPLAQGFALGIPSPTEAILADGSSSWESRSRLPAARELRPAGAEDGESLRSFLRRTG